MGVIAVAGASKMVTWAAGAGEASKIVTWAAGGPYPTHI